MLFLYSSNPAFLAVNQESPLPFSEFDWNLGHFLGGSNVWTFYLRAYIEQANVASQTRTLVYNLDKKFASPGSYTISAEYLSCNDASLVQSVVVSVSGPTTTTQTSTSTTKVSSNPATTTTTKALTSTSALGISTSTTVSSTTTSPKMTLQVSSSPASAVSGSSTGATVAQPKTNEPLPTLPATSPQYASVTTSASGSQTTSTIGNILFVDIRASWCDVC